VSCGNGYLNGNPCPPFLVDKTIEKIEEVKNECRDIYINN